MNKQVYISFDTDDDFLLDIGKGPVTYGSEIYSSISEGIKALNATKIVNDYRWIQEGNIFTRTLYKEPKDHWFLEEIKEAVKSIEKEENYYLGGNQELVVEII
jgi:hypothetical protein